MKNYERSAGCLAAVWFFVTAALIVCSGACASPEEGIWSIQGLTPGLGQTDFVPSPDGSFKVVGSEAGLRLIGGKGINLMIPGEGIYPLWEVVWSPNSRSLAVNASDGGLVGSWNATVLSIDQSGNITNIPASELVKRVARSLPKCFEPEQVNVMVVGWGHNGDELLMIAQVPPHSSCRNMGTLAGYRVSMKSRRIVERLNDRQVRRRWTKMLRADSV